MARCAVRLRKRVGEAWPDFLSRSARASGKAPVFPLRTWRQSALGGNRCTGHVAGMGAAKCGRACFCGVARGGEKRHAPSPPSVRGGAAKWAPPVPARQVRVCLGAPPRVVAGGAERGGGNCARARPLALRLVGGWGRARPQSGRSSEAAARGPAQRRRSQQTPVVPPRRRTPASREASAGADRPRRGGAGSRQESGRRDNLRRPRRSAP